MGAHVSVPMYQRSLAQRLRLEGRRCAACGHVVFPLKAACPSCGARELEPVELSGRGSVTALTWIARAAAPPEFAELADRTGGYHVAIVALEEGPLITGQVVAGTREPRQSDAVEAVVRRLYVEEGVVRYGFKFRVVETGAVAT